jgi:two-component system, chemotaxis family, CheB/CheR fusion protein
VSRDISERKQLDEALRLRSELMKQAHEAIFAWILDGGIMVWNRGAEEL